VCNVEFGYEHGPGGPADRTYRVAQSPEEVARRAWEIAMAGGYPAYYYTYTAWDVIRPDDTPPGYRLFKQLGEFFESTRCWAMAPAADVTNRGWALGDPGREYIVYLSEPQSFSLTLAEAPGYSGEWFHPFDGVRKPAGSFVGGAQEATPPADWRGPAALHVKSTGR
jgi:hypothetical protein